MNSNTNEKINQVSENTLVIGIDIAKHKHFACAIDDRGRVLQKSFPILPINLATSCTERISPLSTSAHRNCRKIQEKSSMLSPIFQAVMRQAPIVLSILLSTSTETAYRIWCM